MIGAISGLNGRHGKMLTQPSMQPTLACWVYAGKET